MKRCFHVETHRRSELINITSQVQAVVREAGLAEGLCWVFVPHTTAGVTINENADPTVVRDLLVTLERMVPWTGDYAHEEGNSAAHMKTSFMGSSVTVSVSRGSLDLGTWQGIFFAEFDGPRHRSVWVRMMPAAGDAG